MATLSCHFSTTTCKYYHNARTGFSCTMQTSKNNIKEDKTRYPSLGKNLGSISSKRQPYQNKIKAPTLSLGSTLLQQAAISASFHYNNVEIVESKANAADLPSQAAVQIAKNLSNLGQIYNREDISTDVRARGHILVEDGVRVHSLVLPELPSSTTVHLSGPGEVYSIKHDIVDVQCLVPGPLLAIRKVVRLKNLVYGLEKFL